MSELSPNTSAFWALVGDPESRPDAKLLNLRPEAQELIAEWCVKPMEYDEATGKPIAGTGGNPYARARLAEHAQRFSSPWLRVSERTLGDFFTTWHVRQRMKRADANAQDATQWFLKFNPADAEKARLFGEFVFMQDAVQSDDPKTFAAMTRARDSRRMLELKERFDTAKLEQKDRQIVQKEKDLALAERRVLLLEDNAQQAKQKLEAVKKAGGLSAETLAQIEEAAKLL